MIRLPLVAGFLMVLLNFSIVLGANCKPKLKQVHIAFRHGDRTPGTTETYPNDPYTNKTYYPSGRGQLTIEGKQREYQLGKMLKSRYGKFLGPIYNPNVLEARSTDFHRTKMSLQLVLSALYPPEPIQEWNNELPWQPIPAIYSPLENDVVLFSVLCSKYKNEYARVRNTPEVKEKIAAFSDLMTSISKFTGQPINGTRELYFLQHTFDAQRSANLTLPEWVNEFYPDGQLRDAAILEYQLSSYTDNLKRLYGGTLLRAISDNAVSHVNGTLDKGRKLYLYSGHEINVAALQSTLGTYEPHVPAYSSAVIIELLRIGNKYFIKVLWYLGIPAKIVTQKIPGCSELCPIDKFLELLEPVIATDCDMLCLDDAQTSAKATGCSSDH